MQWPRPPAEVLPLLTTLSPLIGVATTIAMSRWNASLVRSMALSNSAMTLMLVIAAVGMQHASESRDSGRYRTGRADSGIAWLAERSPEQQAEDKVPAQGIRVRLAFDNDGLSAWPALLLSLTVWTGLCCPGRWDGASISFHCIWLMTSQALLLASCFATDVIVAIVFLEIALVPIYLLIGVHGEDGRRPVAGAWWIWQMIGCSCSLVGVTLLAVALPWMQADLVPARGAAVFDSSLLADSLRQLLARSATAWHLWSHLAPWAAALMLLGLLIRLPLFPFLGWYQSTLVAAPSSVSAVIAVAFPLAALGGWLRLGLPLFGDDSGVVTGILATASLIGLLQSGCAIQSQVDLKQILATLSSAMLCLAGIGLSFHNRDGILGAWLLVLSQGLAVAGGMLLVQILESRCGTRDLSRLAELTKESPRLKGALTVLMLGWGGIPVVSGFSAVYLMFGASSGASLWLILGVSVGIVSIATAAIRNFARMTIQSTSSTTSRAALAPVSTTSTLDTIQPASSKRSTAGIRTDLSGSELAALAPMLALWLMLNLAPMFALKSCESTLLRLLHRSEHRTVGTMEAPPPRLVPGV